MLVESMSGCGGPTVRYKDSSRHHSGRWDARTIQPQPPSVTLHLPQTRAAIPSRDPEQRNTVRCNKTGHFIIKIYCDSNHADQTTGDGKSRSCIMAMVNGMPVVCSSKKQKRVAKSSTEADSFVCHREWWKHCTCDRLPRRLELPKMSRP